MEGRLTGFEDNFHGDEEQAGEPDALGGILGELLAQYQTRFPTIQITVVVVPAA